MSKAVKCLILLAVIALFFVTELKHLEAYVVRRGSDVVADDVTGLSFIDSNVPDGLYRYQSKVYIGNGKYQYVYADTQKELKNAVADLKTI